MRAGIMRPIGNDGTNLMFECSECKSRTKFSNEGAFCDVCLRLMLKDFNESEKRAEMTMEAHDQDEAVRDQAKYEQDSYDRSVGVE